MHIIFLTDAWVYCQAACSLLPGHDTIVFFVDARINAFTCCMKTLHCMQGSCPGPEILSGEITLRCFFNIRIDHSGINRFSDAIFTIILEEFLAGNIPALFYYFGQLSVF